MKRVYKNWLVRITVGFAALTSVRLVSALMHMTYLERIYKPRDFRKTSHLIVDQKMLRQLPAHSRDVIGRQMDPINLIFIGSENGLKHSFEKAGWSGAQPGSPVHLVAASITTLFNRTYKTGPFTPHFINIGLQDLSFQKLTDKKSFAQRHHVRIWRTTFRLPGNQHVWLAAASYDSSLRFDVYPPFLHHHIDPSLDTERDFIAMDLIQNGCLLVDDFQINQPVSDDAPSKNATGAKYFTDGIARIIEVK